MAAHFQGSNVSHRQRTCLHTSAVFVAIWLLAISGCQPPPPTGLALVEKFEQSIASADLKAAVQWAEQIPPESTDWIDSRLQLAEAFTKAKQFESAIPWYQQIIDQKPDHEQAVRARFYRSELERELGRLSAAESGYEQVLATLGTDVATHQRLAFIQSTSGRAWDATPHFLAIVQAGAATPTDLCLLGDLERSVDQQEYVKQCLTQAPTDLVVQLAHAAHLFWEGRITEAEPVLRTVLKERPELLFGQALLGELLVTRDDAEFLKWHDALPTRASDHARIWLVRGLWARRHQSLEVAARCFWETLRREPTSRRAVTQLSQVLLQLKHPAQADFQKRTAELSRLTQLIDEILLHNAQREPEIREVAEILDRVGRGWEACAWGVLVQQQFPEATWPSTIFSHYDGQLTPNLPLVVDKENLALRYDLSRFPPFDELVQKIRNASPSQSSGSQAGAIRFSEELPGPGFVYHSGRDLQTPGARMFEQTGGGVAVIDYDVDGAPDLFFPQGGSWPTGQSQPPDVPDQRDSLYRHRAGLGYVDTTVTSLPADIGFGQGAAAGDVDNDGFPDLYVGNIGRNQLLHNLGDGTFEDLTPLGESSPGAWTASTLIADLNADGNPDLFDVNYVTGPKVYEIICQNRACSPKVFDGSLAQLHANQGDGTFRSVPYGAEMSPGKGLGVVSLPEESPSLLSLFISNDQVANQLLRNQTQPGAMQFQLRDEAMARGAAYNLDGVAMAGMGIAADDVDGNGLTDFFVTNFKDEPNTLYLQDSPGFFVDATNAYGLKGAGLDFVGWGTQFLDVDRDSLSDLVVVNGHVDDYRDTGGEFEMRSQIFHQSRAGQFEELRSPQAGEFWEIPRRGRGLVRLDWNQDGLIDFAVSSLDAPASLVTNQTTSPGHYLNVKLVATKSARDAIGARVTVRLSAEKAWIRHQLAGDGYMASNERVLQFGLGSETKLQELQVEWPSGTISRIAAPPVDQTLLIVESAPRSLPWGPDADKLLPLEMTTSPRE